MREKRGTLPQTGQIDGAGALSICQDSKRGFFKKSWREWFLLLFLLFFFFYSLRKIDLTTVDLGRHIRNGEFFFKDKSVLHKNFYSFTNTDFPFVNHHWGTGVFFYIVYKFFGFAGFSVLFSLISVLTLWIFFIIAWRKSNFALSVLALIVCFPLIFWRSEIRPEMFSYFLCGIFWWILIRASSRSNKNSLARLIFLLPALQLLWINLHSYFFLGFFILGTFILKEVVYFLNGKGRGRNNLLSLVAVFFLSLGLSLINPFGLKGLLYPLHIFDNFGYPLLENQSVFFLDKILGGYPPGDYFRILAVILVFSWLWLLVKNRKFEMDNIFFSAFFLFIAFKAVRNFSILGLFCLPVLASNLSNLRFCQNRVKNCFGYLILFTILVPGIFFIYPSYWNIHRSFGLGLEKGNSASSEFFLKNNIEGPVFNNYDIGGYLIYCLFPGERAFVDNRPEAYPAEFFTQEYIPMQQDDGKWQELDKKYGFNVIFFQRRDLTNWGQQFLVTRIKDQLWAPVFVDNWTIIFLKRNAENEKLIARFELPKELFSVSN